MWWRMHLTAWAKAQAEAEGGGDGGLKVVAVGGAGPKARGLSGRETGGADVSRRRGCHLDVPVVAGIVQRIRPWGGVGSRGLWENKPS